MTDTPESAFDFMKRVEAAVMGDWKLKQIEARDAAMRELGRREAFEVCRRIAIDEAQYATDESRYNTALRIRDAIMAQAKDLTP